MTIEETKRAIEVMQAFVDGKKIEVSQLGYDDWNETTTIFWDWDKYNYRIKPEPHYRPFKNAEEVMEAINEHGCYLIGKVGIRQIIREFDDEIIWTSTHNLGDSYTAVFDSYTFADGTPFGVKLKE